MGLTRKEILLLFLASCLVVGVTVLGLLGFAALIAVQLTTTILIAEHVGVLWGVAAHIGSSSVLLILVVFSVIYMAVKGSHFLERYQV